MMPDPLQRQHHGQVVPPACRLKMPVHRLPAAQERAEEILVTRTRTQGLLVHPHMEGWTAVGAARPCESLEVQA